MRKSLSISRAYQVLNIFRHMVAHCWRKRLEISLQHMVQTSSQCLDRTSHFCTTSNTIDNSTMEALMQEWWAPYFQNQVRDSILVQLHNSLPFPGHGNGDWEWFSFYSRCNVSFDPQIDSETGLVELVLEVCCFNDQPSCPINTS